MKKTKYLLLSAVMLAACSSTTEVPQETEAVRDFIAAADLIEVDRMRTGRSSSGFTYISDRFVIVRDDRRDEHLVEFARRCHELKQPFDVGRDMADYRRDPNFLYARGDTIRGCPVSNVYELTPEQAKELRNLGDAPGEEVYIPPKEES